MLKDQWLNKPYLTRVNNHDHKIKMSFSSCYHLRIHHCMCFEHDPLVNSPISTSPLPSPSLYPNKVFSSSSVNALPLPKHNTHYGSRSPPPTPSNSYYYICTHSRQTGSKVGKFVLNLFCIV